MRHYSLTDLELFAAMAAEGNLTRGAQRLYLSPSSASIRLKKLESALGVPLFRRDPHGLALTAAGAVVQKYCRDVMRGLDAMESDLAPYARREHGLVRIAANYGASIDFLPTDLSNFIPGHPAVKVVLEQKASPDVVYSVANGSADIGVSAFEGDFPGVRFLPYRRDALVVITPPQHPLAATEAAAFPELLDYAFVSLAENSAMQRFIFDKARAAGKVIEPVIQVDNQQILVGLVMQGAGIAVVSNRALELSLAGTVHKVRLKDAWARRNLRIAVASEESHITDNARTLLRFLLEQSGHGGAF